jgi:hypothetical protein
MRERLSLTQFRDLCHPRRRHTGVTRQLYVNILTPGIVRTVPTIESPNFPRNNDTRRFTSARIVAAPLILLGSTTLALPKSISVTLFSSSTTMFTQFQVPANELVLVELLELRNGICDDGFLGLIRSQSRRSSPCAYLHPDV